MVSFWPFRGGEENAQSFEKALSKLSTQINKTSAQNDRFRQQQRRWKALWTLYTSFAYILVSAILTLVTGWERWSYLEYTAVAGSPVAIYGVRTALDAFFNYRISNTQNHLNELNKQREATIERLKTATKYDSTQQLLEKYGGSPPRKRQPSPQPKAKRKSEGGQSKQGTPQQTGRTGFAPPPTANIPGRQSPPGPSPTHGQSDLGSQPPPLGMTPPRPDKLVPPPINDQSEISEEFAPNAFPSPTSPSMPRISQPSQYALEGPKWYDRIFDLVLGEDETQARNRIALICQNCKLVNGQAPPGARTLDDIGRWRCSSCHAWNGVESEEKRILKQISREPPESPISPGVPMSAVTDPGPVINRLSGENNDDPEDEDELDDADSEVKASPAESTRSKARQRNKA